ncbi:MAG: hypothetical protein JWL98_840 [Xanthomonadaceae bacterium]|nr:hypothetical protein [Xanthomonadaceae bacterium]
MSTSPAIVLLVLAASMPMARAADPAVAHAPDEVTIYRCVDPSGHLTLRDTPCGKDQTQQARQMLRPRDAPAAPALPARARSRAPDDDAVPATRAIVMAPPRPMYECTPPDGEPYTSDSAEGNPRWVPFWTLGYPVAPWPHRMANADLAITQGQVHIDARGTVLRRPLYGAAAYGAGTWVRDDCHALPQDEICARLGDRRDEINRRFFNAMPNERDVLRVEERGINARLGNDCGRY